VFHNFHYATRRKIFRLSERCNWTAASISHFQKCLKDDENKLVELEALENRVDNTMTSMVSYGGERIPGELWSKRRRLAPMRTMFYKMSNALSMFKLPDENAYWE